VVGRSGVRKAFLREEADPSGGETDGVAFTRDTWSARGV